MTIDGVVPKILLSSCSRWPNKCHIWPWAADGHTGMNMMNSVPKSPAYPIPPSIAGMSSFYSHSPVALPSIQWLVNVPSFMVFPGRSPQGSLGIHHGNQCSIYFYHVLSMISYDSHEQEVFPYRKGNIFHYIPQCPNLFWGCPGKPG